MVWPFDPPRLRLALPIAVVLAAALGVAGCMTVGNDADAPPPAAEVSEPVPVPPSNYKAEILAFLRTYLNDPGSTRAASITEPFLRGVGGRQRYVACLRYDTRNTAGNYTGPRDRLAVFVRGRFDQLLENGQDACAGATYRPFPELERLGR